MTTVSPTIKRFREKFPVIQPVGVHKCEGWNDADELGYDQQYFDWSKVEQFLTQIEQEAYEEGFKAAKKFENIRIDTLMHLAKDEVIKSTIHTITDLVEEWKGEGSIGGFANDLCGRIELKESMKGETT